MEQAVDIRTVMEILGHSQMSTVQRYLHVATPMAQEAMRRMGQALWEEEKPPRKGRSETETETDRTREQRKRRKRRMV